MQVEVVYALKARQWVEHLDLPETATVDDALSAVAGKPPFCELDLATMPVGVFGERVSRDTRLQSGDRVEIYRPLVIDPKEARRHRAGRS